MMDLEAVQLVVAVQFQAIEGCVTGSGTLGLPCSAVEACS